MKKPLKQIEQTQEQITDLSKNQVKLNLKNEQNKNVTKATKRTKCTPK